MAVGKEIRGKIKSVENTKKITKAMEMVAASKMRKAQDRMRAARPYSDKIRNITANLSQANPEYHSPYMRQGGSAKKVGMIVVTTDKGLCGGLNTNILRAVTTKMRELQAEGTSVEAVAIGNKGFGFLNRIGAKVVSHAIQLGDAPQLEKLIGPVKVMLDEFVAGRLDAVYLCFTQFINTMKQEPQVQQLLPLSSAHLAQSAAEKAQYGWDYLYEPDAKTVLVANPRWWDRLEGNVTEIVYLPIKADATRAAALVTGEVDLVLDPPTQDVPRLRQNPNVRIVDGTEARIIFFGFDQWRDETPYASVKGANPFKDRRVRRALYQAIDAEAIKRATMRGLAVPTGAMIAPQVSGWSEDGAKRLPYDPAAARRLLAEAGYPDGFGFTLDCPNNRYINDEEICQAVVAMWAKVGLKVRLNAMPRSTYFQKVQTYDTSAYLLGWATATFDALYTLQSLIHSVDPKGGADGNFNLGKYANPKADALIDQVKVEADDAKRNAMMREALAIHAADIGHVPLHQQVIPWAMRSNVSAFHRADNRLDVRWVRID